MEITYFNGNYIPKSDVRISPDDRGFLLADGIYDVVRWYNGFFYDMEGHHTRIKRNLKELRINWKDSDLFPSISHDLIAKNDLSDKSAMVYIQVTRGAAKRSHFFPPADVPPTVYSYAWEFAPKNLVESGIRVMLKDDLRWSRCDIKSIALLPNTLTFQEACESGFQEAAFIRNGLINECTHSNIFFVVDNVLFTHPESNYILSGITRKNILRIASLLGIDFREEAIHADKLKMVDEAFITNTSMGIAPVIEAGNTIIGKGVPGPVTKMICQKFDAEIGAMKS